MLTLRFTASARPAFTAPGVVPAPPPAPAPETTGAGVPCHWGPPVPAFPRDYSAVFAWEGEP
jgi:hypothetical protein